MKDFIIDILFSWLFTPVLHLNLAQIFIASMEFIVIFFIIKKTIQIYTKTKEYFDK
ncbi:MAG: hypothetical protein IKE01_06505 [Clostridia bacterium]|nr:hypothetical protein [Clostridia bacterium]